MIRGHRQNDLGSRLDIVHHFQSRPEGPHLCIGFAVFMGTGLQASDGLGDGRVIQSTHFTRQLNELIAAQPSRRPERDIPTPVATTVTERSPGIPFHLFHATHQFSPIDAPSNLKSTRSLPAHIQPPPQALHKRLPPQHKTPSKAGPYVFFLSSQQPLFRRQAIALPAAIYAGQHLGG